MLTAGLLRLGSLLRFVSNAVMVGFMNAVGLSIALGQLGNLTGYDANGDNRVTRAIDTVLSPAVLDWPSVVIGLLTIVLIVALERTPLKSLGLVVAVVASSLAVGALGLTSVETLDDLGVEIGELPSAVTPAWGLIPALVVPALSLALVGLVQGAGISSTFVNPDGHYPNASRDFSAQGAANLASGVLQGMPVGGSVSATLINKASGARAAGGCGRGTRLALTRRALDPGRASLHQARRTSRCVADGTAAEGCTRHHLQSDHGDAPARRGTRWSRVVHRPSRCAAIHPGRRQAADPKL
jgi:SulP family sulfate permease